MTEPDDAGVLEAFVRALDAGDLTMLYQPKIGVADGSLNCVEALVRWHWPGVGSVDPECFVALAEKHDLIEELTRWGLRTSLRQWREWNAQGLETRLAFNISAVSLKQLDFPDLVEAACREIGVPTHQLVIELTEGATQPLVNLMDTLTRFRIKGFGLAIDDFGTGYSSLMQLHQLPFTEVKIDRSFLADVARSPDSRLIVETIVGLAHGLGLTVTGEGVETPEQLGLLRDIGCDLAQGYLISPPIAAAALGDWKRGFEERWASRAEQETLALWR